jgi:hypothetical protein
VLPRDSWRVGRWGVTTDESPATAWTLFAMVLGNVAFLANWATKPPDVCTVSTGVSNARAMFDVSPVTWSKTWLVLRPRTFKSKPRK